MVVISKAAIREFCEKHPDAESALGDWYEHVSEANWKSFAEMKRNVNAVDFVGNDRYVFNIRGNRYRLIALVIFKVRTVFILFIGTHSDYDKVKASHVTYKAAL